MQNVARAFKQLVLFRRCINKLLKFNYFQLLNVTIRT